MKSPKKILNPVDNTIFVKQMSQDGLNRGNPAAKVGPAFSVREFTSYE
jgi:hypothetical protein